MNRKISQNPISNVCVSAKQSDRMCVLGQNVVCFETHFGELSNAAERWKHIRLACIERKHMKNSMELCKVFKMILKNYFSIENHQDFHIKGTRNPVRISGNNLHDRCCPKRMLPSISQHCDKCHNSHIHARSNGCLYWRMDFFWDCHMPFARTYQYALYASYALELFNCFFHTHTHTRAHFMNEIEFN